LDEKVDTHFNLLRVVGDVGEKAVEMIWKLWSQKK
jgi:hypothetical protein